VSSLETLMASLAKDPNGRVRLLFFDPHGRRRTVRLGQVNERQSETYKRNVEIIVGDLIVGRQHEDALSRWIAGLNPKIRTRLEKAGVIKGGQHAVVTLGSFSMSSSGRST
jgi:hypothetical protein